MNGTTSASLLPLSAGSVSRVRTTCAPLGARQFLCVHASP